MCVREKGGKKGGGGSSDVFYSNDFESSSSDVFFHGSQRGGGRAEAEEEEEAKGPSSLDVIKVLKNVGIVGNVDIGPEIAQRKNKIITKEEEETKEG